MMMRWNLGLERDWERNGSVSYLMDTRVVFYLVVFSTWTRMSGWTLSYQDQCIH